MGIGIDFPNQIINVRWGGGILVIKANNGSIYRGEQPGDESAWQALGRPNNIQGGFFANSGSSYGEIGETSSGRDNRVFVLSAGRTNHNGDDGAVIMASSDGKAWNLVFEK